MDKYFKSITDALLCEKKEPENFSKVNLTSVEKGDKFYDLRRALSLDERLRVEGFLPVAEATLKDGKVELPKSLFDDLTGKVVGEIRLVEKVAISFANWPMHKTDEVYVVYQKRDEQYLSLSKYIPKEKVLLKD